jgi:hypothetical protein
VTPPALHACRQVMSVVDEEEGAFGTYSDALHSMLSLYFFMVGGQPIQSLTRFAWFAQVLLVAFTFFASLILLNLLIAVMSDTYAVVKGHAKEEWLLLRWPQRSDMHKATAAPSLLARTAPARHKGLPCWPCCRVNRDPH